MGNPCVRCLSSLLCTQNLQVFELGPHSHNTPHMACERKAMGGHVLVPSSLSGNILLATAPAVPNLSVPSIYEIKALI